jgi:hypothetical protein
MLLHSRRHRQRGANRWRLQELPQRQYLTRIVGSTTDAAPGHSTKPAARTLSASASDMSGPQFGDDAAQEGKRASSPVAGLKPEGIRLRTLPSPVTTPAGPSWPRRQAQSRNYAFGAVQLMRSSPMLKARLERHEEVPVEGYQSGPLGSTPTVCWT